MSLVTSSYTWYSAWFLYFLALCASSVPATRDTHSIGLEWRNTIASFEFTEVRSLTVAALFGRLLHYFKRHFIDPHPREQAEGDHTEIDEGGIPIHLAGDLIAAPLGGADGTIAHVVEKPGLAVRAIDAQQHLGAGIRIERLQPQPGAQANRLPAVRHGAEALHQAGIQC